MSVDTLTHNIARTIETNQKTSLRVCRGPLLDALDEDRLPTLVTARERETKPFGGLVEGSRDDTPWSLHW